MTSKRSEAIAVLTKRIDDGNSRARLALADYGEEARELAEAMFALCFEMESVRTELLAMTDDEYEVCRREPTVN